jgi:hypothetical protein
MPPIISGTIILPEAITTTTMQYIHVRWLIEKEDELCEQIEWTSRFQSMLMNKRVMCQEDVSRMNFIIFDKENELGMYADRYRKTFMLRKLLQRCEANGLYMLRDALVESKQICMAEVVNWWANQRDRDVFPSEFLVPWFGTQIWCQVLRRNEPTWNENGFPNPYLQNHYMRMYQVERLERDLFADQGVWDHDTIDFEDQTLPPNCPYEAGDGDLTRVTFKLDRSQFGKELYDPFYVLAPPAPADII